MHTQYYAEDIKIQSSLYPHRNTVCCKRPTHTKDSYQPVGVLSEDRAHEGTQGKLSGMSKMVPTKLTQPFLR